MLYYNTSNSVLPDVLSRFYTNLPSKPYCTNELDYGLKIKSKCRAIRYCYIQPQFKIIYYLILDVDRAEGGASWIDANLPKPTYIIVNGENGHAHLIYELRVPVLTWDNAHSRPAAYYDALRASYTEAVGADLGYTSLITKNPHNKRWTTFVHDCRYDLGELGEYVALEERHYRSKRSIREDYAGLGRNCTLFEVGRIFSYDIVCGVESQEKLYASVYAYIWEHNITEFSEPLFENEVQRVAKSISKWTWKNRHNFENRSEGRRRKTRDDAEVKERQIQSAYSTHEIRKAATEAKIKKAIDTFLREGRKITKAGIAREAGITRQTLDRYQNLLP